MVCEDCGTCEGCKVDTDGEGNGHHPHKNLEHGFKKFWRPLAGYIYLAICIFDFMGAPLWIEYSNQNINTAAFVEIAKFEDKDVQMALIQNMQLGSREWSPLTLMGGAFFHIAFGAILGVAAFSRGKEKVAAINR